MDATNIENNVNGEHVKCPSCGGEMAFSPENNMLVCPYCGAHQEIVKETGATVEERIFQASSSNGKDWGVATKVIQCGNCGSSMVVEATATAQVCAYCGSPLVTESENPDEVAPEAVLPFKISSDTAKQYFKDWVRSRFYAPKALRVQNRLQRIYGVYVPHFTYDCTTGSSYTAEAGKHYYVKEMVSVNRDGKQVMEERQVMKTRWTPVSGSYNDSFDDVLIPASKNIDDKLIKLNYNLKELVPYQKEYLYSFQAENNSISKEDCWKTAQNEIDRELRTRITRSLHADEVRNLSYQTTFSNVTFKSVLLPAWVSSYQFKNKTYKFMINGQSGEVRGQSPVSALRVLSSILLALVVTFICFALNPIFGGIVMVTSGIFLIWLAVRKPKTGPKGKKKAEQKQGSET